MATSILEREQPTTAGGGTGQEPPINLSLSGGDFSPGNSDDWNKWTAEVATSTDVLITDEPTVALGALRAHDKELSDAANQGVKQRLQAQLEAAKATEGGRGYLLGERPVTPQHMIRAIGTVVSGGLYRRPHQFRGMPTRQFS